MSLTLNLNNLYFILLLVFSCNDPAIITACSPNQELDSCGNCYYTQNDPSWNDCVDDCGIANGQNICDAENISNNNCDCAGCKELGDPYFCEDCLHSDACECDNSFYSYYTVNTNSCNNNECESYFETNSLNLNIRERCGVLTNIDTDYIINIIDNIQINDPCENIINMTYYDDTNQVYDIADGCDLPINNIYILENGDVLYNSSDDIGNFEFTIENHCVDLASNICLTVPGCNWGNNNQCLQNNINSISGGDAERQEYYISSVTMNNQYKVQGIYSNSVIPHNTDYLNSIQIKNNDYNNSIYIKWDNIIFTENGYMEIPPNQIIIITHNNWCNNTYSSINVDNDNLTINPSSQIEGFHFDNNNYIKFGEIDITLIFDSLEQLSNNQNQSCN